MSTLASVLKSEIRRLAKKEARTEVSTLRSASIQYRHDIAALKRTNKELGRKVALLEATLAKRAVASPTEANGTKVRFAPEWVSGHRKKIGLSQDAYALLVGVAPMTIYNWESGKSRPQARQLAAWGAVKKLGKREAAQRLELLESKGRRPRRRLQKKAKR